MEEQVNLSEHEEKILNPLRKCKTCSLEAFTYSDLEQFAKNPTGLYGRQNKCKECRRKERQEARDSDLNLGKNSRYLRLYGISYDDVQKIKEEQNHSCAICGTKEAGGHGEFHVDHNHKTGKVRGLLCHGCNTGIGGLKDDPKVLYKAIKYLEERGYYGDTRK